MSYQIKGGSMRKYKRVKCFLNKNIQQNSIKNQHGKSIIKEKSEERMNREIQP